MRYLFRCKQIRVIDGDTVECELDRGLDGTVTPVTLRLQGVYAPERGQTGYVESGDYLRDLIWSYEHDGWPFVIETFKRPRVDKTITTLSRYVAVIYADNEKVNINEQVAAWLATHPEYPKGEGS